MNNLKVLTTAVALVFVTPVLAQEMGGATGPGSASGLEPTFNNGYYSGYDVLIQTVPAFAFFAKRCTRPISRLHTPAARL